MILLPPSLVSEAVCNEHTETERGQLLPSCTALHYTALQLKELSRAEDRNASVLACFVAHMTLLAMKAALPGKLHRLKSQVSLQHKECDLIIKKEGLQGMIRLLHGRQDVA